MIPTDLHRSGSSCHSAGRRQGDVDERYSAALDRDDIGLGSHRPVARTDRCCACCVLSGFPSIITSKDNLLLLLHYYYYNYYYGYYYYCVCCAGWGANPAVQCKCNSVLILLSIDMK